jgi:hypothetical protein
MQRSARIWLIATALGAAACVSGEAPPAEGEASVEASVSASALYGIPSNARWSSLITLPLVPGAAANLPDGKVVFWAAYDDDDYRVQGTNTVTAVFDPQTGTHGGALNSNTGHDMFCPGTTNLPDGRILVNGGSTNNKTSIYNPGTGAWTASGEMSIGRGYQANTLLADGSVLTLGGSWSGDGMQAKDAEVWSDGTWRRLPNLVLDGTFNATANEAKYLDNHMWLFPMSNGRVLHAGPGVQMHWLDAVGDGAVEPIGSRGNDASSLNGSVVMYDVDKILKVGGAPDYGSDTEPYQGLNATNTAHVIELNAQGGVTVTQTSSMAYARVFAHAVVLPTGEVVVVGGSTRPKLFSNDYAVLVPEIWDPVTKTFVTMPATQARARPYHSVALLLTDGRVLVAGGGLGPNATTANHPNLEILSPPYLFNNDGSLAVRPVLLSAPTSASHGGTISVTTSLPVSSFALVRMSSATHSINNDQRRIPLTFSTTGSNTYALNIPANRGVVLPGSYMLFAMLANGTPSVAKVIQIGAALTPVGQVQAPDVYVWRFFTDPVTSGRPNARSAYYYMATTAQAVPTPPAGYVLDSTTPGFMFQAWSTSGDGRVPIQLCRNGYNHWLGNGCNGDTSVQTLFYAYPAPLRGSTKVLHYVSTAWGGKLIIPYTAQTKAQIDGLDANVPADPWTPWINRSPNDLLAPFYVSSTTADRYVWRFFSQPGARPDVRSAYAYLATPTTAAPPAPSSYTLDTTTYGTHMFRAWSTPGAGRIPVNHCYNVVSERHWLGYGCAGDVPLSILFYAYPSSTADGNVKSLHYVSKLWGGKLIIPSHAGTAAQIDGLDAAPADWQAWINRTTINNLTPYWVAGP